MKTQAKECVFAMLFIHWLITTHNLMKKKYSWKIHTTPWWSVLIDTKNTKRPNIYNETSWRQKCGVIFNDHIIFVWYNVQRKCGISHFSYRIFYVRENVCEIIRLWPYNMTVGLKNRLKFEWLENQNKTKIAHQEDSNIVEDSRLFDWVALSRHISQHTPKKPTITW